MAIATVKYVDVVAFAALKRVISNTTYQCIMTVAKTIPTLYFIVSFAAEKEVAP